MYSERFRDHFEHPRNPGELPAPAEQVEVSNPACGDILRLSVLWNGEDVAEARYKVRGCAASIAAGSALTIWLQGRARNQLHELTTDDIESEIGPLKQESKHAAVLCLDAVNALLRARR